MKARYYTYRNLNQGTSFSTKHRGLVIARFDAAILMNVDLKVSVRGRERAIRTGTRNVHAFAVSDMMPLPTNAFDVSKFTQIKYNPFKSEHFLELDPLTGLLTPIKYAKWALFQDGNMYNME